MLFGEASIFVLLDDYDVLFIGQSIAACPYRPHLTRR